MSRSLKTPRYHVFTYSLCGSRGSRGSDPGLLSSAESLSWSSDPLVFTICSIPQSFCLLTLPHRVVTPRCSLLSTLFFFCCFFWFPLRNVTSGDLDRPSWGFCTLGGVSIGPRGLFIRTLLSSGSAKWGYSFSFPTKHAPWSLLTWDIFTSLWGAQNILSGFFSQLLENTCYGWMWPSETSSDGAISETKTVIFKSEDTGAVRLPLPGL